MNVFHCPGCELSFRFATELRDHLALDHPHFHSEQKTVEDALLAASHRPRSHAPEYPPGFRPAPVGSGEARRAEPETTLVVAHEGGDRFTISLRGHEIPVDQPVAAGGTDTAPTPTELLVAALASCVAFYGRRFLARHRLPDDVRVAAEWHLGSKPARVEGIRLTVDAPGLPESMRPRFVKVIDHCTVHNTLRAAPSVTIEIAAPRRDEIAG